ncbi:glycosyltransferase family 4 protein, partial [Vibrio chagasii]
MKVNRVLVLTNMYPHGESQKGIFVKEFVDTMNSSEKFELDVLSIDIYSKSYKNYIFSFIYLLNKIKSKKYNIINVHFGLSIIPVLMLLPFIRYQNIRIITTLHGSDLMGSRIVNLISNLAVLVSESTIVVSKEMCSFIFKSLREKAHVIPCGVDLSFTYSSRPNWNKKNVLNLIFPSDPARKEKKYSLFNDVVFKLEQSGIRVKVHIFKDLS